MIDSGVIDGSMIDGRVIDERVIDRGGGVVDGGKTFSNTRQGDEIGG